MQSHLIKTGKLNLLHYDQIGLTLQMNYSTSNNIHRYSLPPEQRKGKNHYNNLNR